MADLPSAPVPDADHAAMQRLVHEMDRERGYLRAMVLGARRMADVSRADHLQARGHFLAETARMEARMAEAEAEAAPLRVQIAALQAELAEAERRLAAARAEQAAWIEAVRTSWSWRLTGPLRMVLRPLRRVVRR